jgi:hypothetical protein
MTKRKKTTRDGSKSAAIRSYIAAHPNAKPKEILSALSEQGIEVSVGLVSVVKYAKPKGKKRTARKQSRNTTASGDISAADLIAAKKLADSLGGVSNAQAALELLEKLT